MAGTSSAVVTITDKYPLNITKVDSTALSKEISDPKARFTVLDEDDNVVVSGASVQNNKLVIREGDVVKAVLVDAPGKYKVREDRAPSGYFRAADPVEVTVNTDGTSSEVLFENTPAKTGKVSITKEVNGAKPANVGATHDFTFGWTAEAPSGVLLNEGDESGTVTVKGGETKTLDVDFPVGTVVTFTEQATSQALLNHHFDGLTPTSLTATVEKDKTVTVTATNEYTPVVSVGDYVWLDDNNRDGIQDDGEPGINGVKLVLTKNGQPVKDVDGNEVEPVLTATKDGKDGYYNFGNLPALKNGESYTVTVADDNFDEDGPLYGYVPTLPGQGTDRGADSSTISVSAGPNQDGHDLTVGGGHNPTLDFGFVTPSYAVGDYVWIDYNGNGIQEAGEPALEDVTVTLLDEDDKPVTENIKGDDYGTVTTDENGHYLFDNLPAGAYKVRFTLTEDQGKQYQFTKYLSDKLAEADENAVVDANEKDSNAKVTANPLVAESAPFVLDDSNEELIKTYTPAVKASQGIDPTWDAGVRPKAVTVGNYVWKDLNRDGLQGSETEGDEDYEPGVPGVELQLVRIDLDGDGTEREYPVKHIDETDVINVTTDKNGHYEFTNLPVLKEGESYRVKIVSTPTELDGWIPTAAGDGKDPLDSSTDYADAPAAPGDKNYDLTKDAGTNPTLDFGFIEKTYAIGDKVWIDTDRQGDQNEDAESVLKGVTVELFGADDETVAKDVFGNEVEATETDENGRYFFDNLPAGTYKVKFTLTEAQAQVYEFSEPLVTSVGSEDDVTSVSTAQDSDADKATGLTGEIELGAGNTALSKTYSDQKVDFTKNATEGIDPTWDAGVHLKKVSVGNYVWIDANRDGLHDEDEVAEKGIAGVTLHLSKWKVGKDGAPDTVVLGDDKVLDVNGNAVGAEITGTDGKYLFENLPALADGYYYKVTIGDDEDTLEVLSIYDPTKVTSPDSDDYDRGLDSSLNSEIAPASGLQTEDAEDLTLDFGFFRKAVSVGNYVWIDTDREGDQDSTEAGINNVQLTLVWIDAKGTEHTTVTDIYGELVGPTTTKDRDGKAGYYEFSNLPALKEGEKYVVKIDNNQEVLKPYLPTTEGEIGGSGVLDSSTSQAVAEANDEFYPLLEDGEFNDTLDFGFVLRSYAIGDKVWIDTDRQGDQNEDAKSVLEGVKVELFEEDGVTPAKDVFGNTVEATKTDENGRYLFDNLPAGTYKVKFTLTKEQSEVYRFTTNKDSAASNEAADSDTNVDSSNPAVAVTNDIVLGPDNAALSKTYAEQTIDYAKVATEGIDPTWDAGVVHKRVSVGTFVWVDADRDGKHAVDEDPDVDEGIGNVLLKLSIVDDDGNEVTPAGGILDIYNNVVTDLRTADGSDPDEARGHYLFTNLRALNTGQHYKVSIDFDDPQTKEALSEYVATTPGDGSDKGLDSSVGSETTKGTDLQFDEAEDLSLDFGFHKPSFAIGDLVWIDLNGNGVQDETEKPLEGVKVTLLDKDGNEVTHDVQGKPISPITVGEDGRYLFDNLEEGTYKVKFELTPEQGLKYQFTELQSKNATESVDDSDGIVENTTALTAVTREITLDLNNSALKSQAEYSDEDFADFDGIIVATHGIDPTWDAGVMPKSVSVGDLVWEDLNHDGTQDKNEPGIKDVLLFLTDKDGNSVKDIFGEDVPPVYTDEDGHYSFDNLPALKKGEEYQVHIFAADEETAKVLKPYKPTTQGEYGGSGEFDSSTLVAVATSEGLTENGNRNPTLDFGFVKKAVSVGDKVWFDKNKNGIQGDGEPGIPDVKLILTDKDGNPVHDVYGKPVKPIWTGPNGEYEFTDLPTLEPGQEYRVKIDTTDKKSRDALKDLMPTSAKSGKDRGLDSDTWVAIATSEGLTEDGDHNPTLDFGFVPVELPDAGSEPDGLSQTGFGGLPAAGFGALLAVGGVLLILGTRRRQRR